MCHNCRKHDFHKETKKQNSCVKWQGNIPHLWIKVHLRSWKLSQRILQISWKSIISLLLNDLSCEIYLVWRVQSDHAHRMGYLFVYSYSLLPPLYSTLQVSCSHFMKFLLFSGVNLCRLQKRVCNGMVFIVVASTMVTARGVTNKICRGKT